MLEILEKCSIHVASTLQNGKSFVIKLHFEGTGLLQQALLRKNLSLCQSLQDSWHRFRNIFKSFLKHLVSKSNIHEHIYHIHFSPGCICFHIYPAVNGKNKLWLVVYMSIRVSSCLSGRFLAEIIHRQKSVSESH